MEESRRTDVVILERNGTNYKIYQMCQKASNRGTNSRASSKQQSKKI